MLDFRAATLSGFPTLCRSIVLADPLGNKRVSVPVSPHQQDDSITVHPYRASAGLDQYLPPRGYDPEGPHTLSKEFERVYDCRVNATESDMPE